MEPKMKTWTIKTIRDGEAVHVEKGVAHHDAVKAIYHAMRGQDPIGAGLGTVRGEQAPVAERAIAA
jgi:hypothetical protein